VLSSQHVLIVAMCWQRKVVLAFGAHRIIIETSDEPDFDGYEDQCDEKLQML
jgi:hypothetical protein